MENNSIYIHIPFCKSICSYCDFCKFLYNEKWINEYLNSLEKEILKKYDFNNYVNTLYVGGGTPSSLNKDMLNKLFNIINKFKFHKNYEFTFECNLNDITEDLLITLKDNKVNRLSIGIESFNKDKLKFLNRKSDYNLAINKINLCKKYINNINIDLIYGIPFETLDILKEDLKLFIDLDVNHISTYSLIIEDNTILKYQNIKPISEDIDYEMYNEICTYLKDNNYIHYEISNFAKKGYESKHNLVYWHNQNYYGFGLSSSSYINNIRYDNTKNLTEYLKGNYVLNKEILSKKDIMDYEVILGLRLINGINIDNFKNKYNEDIITYYNLNDLINNKYLMIKNGNIFINPDKLYIMNEILLKIV